MNAEIIFGPDVGSLKGKTTRQDPLKVRMVRSMLPVDMFKRNQEVTLCVDIMYINGNPFLASVSRKIKFGTIQELSLRSKDNVKDYRPSSGHLPRRWVLCSAHAHGWRV
jgi:hypothetical protein